jgi:hypothetical protein
MTDSKQTASTILQQLGGNKFIDMTGSHTFVCDKNWLRMTLTKNKIGAKWLRITLNSMDTYDMEFIKEQKKKELFGGIVIEQKNRWKINIKEKYDWDKCLRGDWSDWDILKI